MRNAEGANSRHRTTNHQATNHQRLRGWDCLNLQRRAKQPHGSLPMSRHVPRHTFRCPPPPRVMVARPARPAQVTQVPITLTQHDIAAAPCDMTHPMWRHRGTARPEPPPPWLGKLHGIGVDSTMHKKAGATAPHEAHPPVSTNPRPRIPSSAAIQLAHVQPLVQPHLPRIPEAVRCLSHKCHSMGQLSGKGLP